VSKDHDIIDHLGYDCVASLQRAAQLRFDDAKRLGEARHNLAALYLLGYAVESSLAAASFRQAGYRRNTPIDRDARNRRMVWARRTIASDEAPLMSSDPHPLVGWARLLQHQHAVAPNLPEKRARLLAELVRRTTIVYRNWRPELRYKTTVVSSERLEFVLKNVEWLLDTIDSL
jgi:hypothetical protein